MELINAAPCTLGAEFLLDESLALGANQMYEILVLD